MVFVGAISSDRYPTAESGRSLGVTGSNGEFQREIIFALEVVMRDVRRIRINRMDIYAKVKYNRPEELIGVINGAFM